MSHPAPLIPRNDRRLDRIPLWDPRNSNYPIRTLVGGLAPRSYSWSCDVHNDQKQDGACVGFGFGHELIARPRVVQGVTALFCKEKLYWEIQKRDPWPGGAYPGAEQYYDGTSVLSGATYLKEIGFYDQYRWATSLQDLILAVGHHGPAVIGVNWLTGMMEPDSNGVIHLTGQIEGGHCTLIKGYSLKYRRFTIHQSWGEEWGIHGDCYMDEEEVGMLIDKGNDGEACIPVVRMPRMSV